MTRLHAQPAVVHRAATWIGVVITVAFGYFAVRDVSWSDAWAALRSTDPWWLVLALAVLAVTVVLRAVRWQSLFAADRRPAFANTFSALLIGYFFNNVLPARAGEVARVVALHRAAGTSRAELAATVVVERIFDVLSLVVLLLVATPWLPAVSWLGSAAILGASLAAACVVVVIAVAVWRDKPFRLLLRPLTLLPFLAEERLARAALNLTHGLAAINRPRVAIRALAWTLASWLSLALSAWLVLVACDLGLSPLAGLLVVVAVNLALVLPSSPAGVGVFEAATVVALSTFDIPRSAALSTALVLHLLNFLPYLVAGGLVLRRPERLHPSLSAIPDAERSPSREADVR
jgi:glycosyltransferase 2 family protein